MNTFFNILQKHANCSIIRYHDDKPFVFKDIKNVFNQKDKQLDSKQFIISCYIHNIISKIYKKFGYVITGTTKILYYIPPFQKIRMFYNIFTRQNNTDYLFLDQYVDEILTIFSKAQRTYYAFSRLAHIYRLKKYKTVVTDDLSMTPLDKDHGNTFILIQNKTKYLFNLNDIVKIVETSITNAPNFFQEPNKAKNPYNNENLNYSTLYNIYFKLKTSGRIMSIIFHLYFLSNFNLDKFVLNNEAYLRDITIQKYIHNATPSVLYKSIATMLNSNFYSKKLDIHVDFPKDLLLEIFKPFLYYYFIVNYDIQGTHRTSVFKRILYIKLKKFYKYNTTFGRKILHSKPKLFDNFNLTKKWQPFSFITHHISFHNIKVYDTDTDFVETADIISNTNINTNTNIPGNNYINNDSTIDEEDDDDDDDEDDADAEEDDDADDDAEEDDNDENNTLEHGYNTTESDTIEDDDEIDDISLS
jgi:hypothetical protein